MIWNNYIFHDIIFHNFKLEKFKKKNKNFDEIYEYVLLASKNVFLFWLIFIFIINHTKITTWSNFLQ